MEKKKLSLTFRMLRALGFNYSEEEYGDVSLWKVFGKFFGNIRLKFLEGMLDWSGADRAKETETVYLAAYGVQGWERMLHW